MLDFFRNWNLLLIGSLQSNFYNLKIPPPLLGFEPKLLGYKASALTSILTLQVRLKGIKVCAQQSMSSRKVTFALNFANLETSLIVATLWSQWCS